MHTACQCCKETSEQTRVIPANPIRHWSNQNPSPSAMRCGLSRPPRPERHNSSRRSQLASGSGVGSRTVSVFPLGVSTGVRLNGDAPPLTSAAADGRRAAGQTATREQRATNTALDTTPGALQPASAPENGAWGVRNGWGRGDGVRRMQKNWQRSLKTGEDSYVISLRAHICI